MTNRQKEVQESHIKNEKAILRDVERIYRTARRDIAEKIREHFDAISELNEKISALDPSDPKRFLLESERRSKIYQLQHQGLIDSQLSDILDRMSAEEYALISDYLERCYEEGYLGTLYSMQGQGVPLMLPIDQPSIVKAVQIDSQISASLYEHLGESVGLLKRSIAGEVARLIANGNSYHDAARSLSSYTRIGYHRSMRIIRTEGHRIQTAATMDCMRNAKDAGADIVKQWDSALDGRTRQSHVEVDREIRELDEPFSNGLMRPGDETGPAAEVINCRCALLERARWAVGGGFLKRDNFNDTIIEFDSPEGYNAFKKSYHSAENKDYMKFVYDKQVQYGTKNMKTLVNSMTESELKRFKELEKASPFYKERKSVETHLRKKQAKTFTAKELDDMTLSQLRKHAEDVATRYYKSGASGISFGDADISTVVKRLSASGSKASLKKDILSMQRKMKK